MKEIIFLGKRKARGSPKAQWPNAHLAGTTHSNQKYARRYGTVDDWDSWWDLHPFNPVPRYDGIKKKRLATYHWYQTLPGPGDPRYRPLWLAELDPSIKAGKLFPSQQLLDACGSSLRRWLTCQVDLMMAYHILIDRHDHIILHGHGIGREPGHMVDHVGVIVWLQVAREHGIEVTIVKPSWYLGQERPYGISTRTGWDSLR